MFQVSSDACGKRWVWLSLDFSFALATMVLAIGLKVFRCRPSNWNPNSAVLHIITMFTQKMSLLHAHCMLGS